MLIDEIGVVLSPLSPFGPDNPGGPFSPVGPCKPGGPSKPGGPLSPLLPWRPGGPSKPGGPLSPLSPLSPGGPAFLAESAIAAWRELKLNGEADKAMRGDKSVPSKIIPRESTPSNVNWSGNGPSRVPKNPFSAFTATAPLVHAISAPRNNLNTRTASPLNAVPCVCKTP